MKVYVRIYEPGYLILRIHNIDGQSVKSVNIQDKDNKSPVLEYIFGASDSLFIIGIEEVTLTTVMNKQEMLKNKYTWNNLSVEVPPLPG